MTKRDALNSDALLAKYELLKNWMQFSTGRPEKLGVWTTGRTDGGDLIVSAEVRGTDPGPALTAFTDRQAALLGNQKDRAPGDQLPSLDLSQPGRVAYVWRNHNVWVELWHSDSCVDTSHLPEPVRGAPVPSVAAQAASPSPSSPAVRRAFLRRPSARLPFTRRKKETPTA